MGNGIRDLSSYLPIVEVVRSYRRQDLPHDVVAGVAVGMLSVPQAVAYALLAGLPAQAGLYACLAPMVIHALLSSSRQLIVGPVAIAALMVASTVGQHADAYSNAYLGITTVLSLQVGLILILLRLLQVGGIVNLLSHPVISGFVNGAAVVIIVSQLAPLTGIATTSRLDDGAVDRLALLVRSVSEVNPTALALGVGSLLLMAAVRRWGPALVRTGPKAGDDGDVRHALGRTGPVLVTVLGTAVVAGFALDVGVVGNVPAGLPELTLPLLDARLWWDLAPNAVLIALVAFVESYSIGKTLAARQRRRIDSHQELVALGAANIGASLSGAYPVAGSFSRSSVNYASGARTPASALVCAVIIVLTLLWLTPLFANLPHAVLAAVVIAAVYELADFRSVVRDWRFYRGDVLTHFATFAGVLLAGVEAGLLIGVGISVVLFMRGSARPHIAVVGRLGDTPHFRNVKRYEARTWPHLVAARVDESFYFANADTLESRLAELLDNPGGGDPDDGQAVEHLLIIMSAVNFIDTTGLEMLQAPDPSPRPPGRRDAPLRDQGAGPRPTRTRRGRRVANRPRIPDHRRRVQRTHRSGWLVGMAQRAGQHKGLGRGRIGETMKLLVANRGEIAIRIMRAAAELGVPTVAVAPADDAGSLHTGKADEAVALDGAGAAAYLDIEQIVAAAVDAGCDALHPGYGFLAENADLARRCAGAGVTFVGPRVETLELFGDKARARAAATDAGIPVIRGIDHPVSVDEAAAFLDALGEGRGMMIKAVGGGGGRGSRRVAGANEVAATYERCRAEALAAFGNGDLYVEEFIGGRATSRCRSSATPRAASPISASASAACSGTSRRSSRWRRRPVSRTNCANGSSTPRCASPAGSATATPGPSSSWSTSPAGRRTGRSRSSRPTRGCRSSTR